MNIHVQSVHRPCQTTATQTTASILWTVCACVCVCLYVYMCVCGQIWHTASGDASGASSDGEALSPAIHLLGHQQGTLEVWANWPKIDCIYIIPSRWNTKCFKVHLLCLRHPSAICITMQDHISSHRQQVRVHCLVRWHFGSEPREAGRVPREPWFPDAPTPPPVSSLRVL